MSASIQLESYRYACVNCTRNCPCRMRRERIIASNRVLWEIDWNWCHHGNLFDSHTVELRRPRRRDKYILRSNINLIAKILFFEPRLPSILNYLKFSYHFHSNWTLEGGPCSNQNQIDVLCVCEKHTSKLDCVIWFRLEWDFNGKLLKVFAKWSLWPVGLFRSPKFLFTRLQTPTANECGAKKITEQIQWRFKRDQNPKTKMDDDNQQIIENSRRNYTFDAAG